MMSVMKYISQILIQQPFVFPTSNEMNLNFLH